MDFHFDCIFHSVKDMETAIQFYRDVLGFKLVSRDEVARFDMDGVLFELVPAGARRRELLEMRGFVCKSKMSKQRCAS